MKRITRKYIRKRKSYIKKKQTKHKKITRKRIRKINKTKRKRGTKTKIKKGGNEEEGEKEEEEGEEEEEEGEDPVAKELKYFFKTKKRKSVKIFYPHQLEVGKVYNEIDCKPEKKDKEYTCSLLDEELKIHPEPLLYMGVYVVLDKNFTEYEIEKTMEKEDIYDTAGDFWYTEETEYTTINKIVNGEKEIYVINRKATEIPIPTPILDKDKEIGYIMNRNLYEEEGQEKKKEKMDREENEKRTKCIVYKLYFESKNGPVYRVLNRISKFVQNFDILSTYIKNTLPGKLYINVVCGKIRGSNQYLLSINNEDDEDKEFIDDIIKEKIEWPYNIEDPNNNTFDKQKDLEVIEKIDERYESKTGFHPNPAGDYGTGYSSGPSGSSRGTGTSGNNAAELKLIFGR